MKWSTISQEIGPEAKLQTNGNINLPDIHAQKELARKYMEENLWVPIYDKLLIEVKDVLNHPCWQQHIQYLAAIQHQWEQKGPKIKISLEYLEIFNNVVIVLLLLHNY
jgi:hypothetical protein